MSRACRVPVRVIRNATEFSYLDSREKIEAVREKYGIGRHENLLLFLSRISVGYKNIDFLLESLKLLHDEGFPFFLVMAGDGPDLEWVKRTVERCGMKNQVLFTGMISDREEREAVYQLCDLFVFPSYKDTAGLVKFEAASQKKPTLCLENTAVSEEILDGVNGYPVEADTLTEGKAVNVYVGPAMTMSLPPIANGIMIITDVPEDAAFPKYTQVESLDQGSADGEFVLTTVDGSEYTITAETRLLPYLTKNIVSEEDLTEGTDILVWTSADDAAKTEKIVIFQSGN